MKMFQNKKSVAFTLAEILMVMGIIGVVAAITIPNLNKNIGDQERVAKVQTMVADVDQAYKIALKKYDDEWTTNSYGPRILEFMQTKLTCTTANASNCAPLTYKQRGSVVSTGIPNQGVAATFNDGSTILFGGNIAYIDIDGKGGYQTLGVDGFLIGFGESGLLMNGSENDSNVTNYTSWIVKNGNAEYLHCNTVKNSNITCK
mgnify:FL=1